MKKIFALILCSIQCATTYPRHHQKIVYAPYEQTKQEATIAVSGVSNDELKKCFGSSIAKTTTPLKISITNRGNRTLSFLPEDISLPLKSHRQVQRLFSRTIFGHLWSALPWALGISVLLTAYVASFASPDVLGAFVGFYLPSVLFETTIVGALINRWNRNRKITKLSSCHNVITSDTQEIALPAGSTCDAYLFVRTKKFSPEFEITLHGTVTHEALKFPINLVST